MKNSLLQEISISLALIILLILLLNPFDLWMPNSLLVMIILVLITVFAVFTNFVWKENVRDEREGLHRMLAGRVGFLVGSGVLVMGIIIQCFQHNLDIWLVVALSTMVLAKVIGRIYIKENY